MSNNNMIPVLDAQGHPVLDANGQPVFTEQNRPAVVSEPTLADPRVTPADLGTQRLVPTEWAPAQGPLPTSEPTLADPRVTPEHLRVPAVPGYDHNKLMQAKAAQDKRQAEEKAPAAAKFIPSISPEVPAAPRVAAGVQIVPGIPVAAGSRQSTPQAIRAPASVSAASASNPAPAIATTGMATEPGHMESQDATLEAKKDPRWTTPREQADQPLTAEEEASEKARDARIADRTAARAAAKVQK